MKYLWEAKPPLTRSDVFAEGWEVDTFHAATDEEAIAKIERLRKRHEVGQPLTIKLSCEGRAIRTFKS